MSLRGHFKKRKRGADKRWRRLYARAVKRAEAASDPRLQDLRHFAADPEHAVRRLSIISEVDLDREFPPTHGEGGAA